MFPIEKEIIASEVRSQKIMSSSDMREQVQKAVVVQQERYVGTKYKNNGELDEKGIEKFCRLNKECKGMIAAAYDRLGLSMRGCSRIIKVARTIADLEETENKYILNISICMVACGFIQILSIIILNIILTNHYDRAIF